MQTNRMEGEDTRGPVEMPKWILSPSNRTGGGLTPKMAFKGRMVAMRLDLTPPSFLFTPKTRKNWYAKDQSSNNQ